MAERQNLTRKLIAAHLVSGEMVPGEEIGIRIDQTLTQDATGTLAYLMFEAMGLPRIKTRLSVSYVDHQLLQVDTRNADDHTYLQDVAVQVRHPLLEARQRHLPPGPPGALLGAGRVRCSARTATRRPAAASGCSRSGRAARTSPTAMAGLPFYLRMPRVMGVELRGKLQPFVASKDVILEMLRRLTSRAGSGASSSTSVRARPRWRSPTGRRSPTWAPSWAPPPRSSPRTRRPAATCAARAARSDFRLVGAGPRRRVRRAHRHQPGSSLGRWSRSRTCPDNVVPVGELVGMPVDQVAIGSCTNSSYQDLMVMAKILKGKMVHPQVNAVCQPRLAPGLQHDRPQRRAGRPDRGWRAASWSRRAGRARAWAPCRRPGADLAAGVQPQLRGPLRRARHQRYLASPVTCAARGHRRARSSTRDDHRRAGPHPRCRSELPDRRPDDHPAGRRDGSSVEIRRGPNIKPIPTRAPDDARRSSGQVLTRVGDNISTDGILPGPRQHPGAALERPGDLGLRLQAASIRTFVERAKALGGGFIVAGQNYGQGSSREHAALGPELPRGQGGDRQELRPHPPRQPDQLRRRCR